MGTWVWMPIYCSGMAGPAPSILTIPALATECSTWRWLWNIAMHLLLLSLLFEGS